MAEYPHVIVNPSMPPDSLIMFGSPSKEAAKEMQGMTLEQRIEALVKLKKLVLVRGIG
jgi:hypothetical protein